MRDSETDAMLFIKRRVSPQTGYRSMAQCEQEIMFAKAGDIKNIHLSYISRINTFVKYSQEHPDDSMAMDKDSIRRAGNTIAYLEKAI